MKKIGLTYAIIPILVFFMGCAGGTSLVDFVKEGGLETSGLTNLALASNGTTVMVSQENPDHPSSTLINGITSSENWDQGEGWESGYDGRLARGQYLYRSTIPPSPGNSDREQETDVDDPTWRGLKVNTSEGRIDTALGWVIIEFPEEKAVNRAIIYTVDSEEYPADKFGVSDLALQYWNERLSSWMTVERIGKEIGQTGNAIHNNKSKSVTFRFEPIRTTKMRLIVRWTNDSDQETRGYYTYTNGTIRLVEVEIYGYERAEVVEEAAPDTPIQDANKIAEIEIIINNYAEGYNKKNANMLMSSISPDYSKDGETYSDLKKRMESIFAEHDQVEFGLQDIRVNLAEEGAKATSKYTLQYGPSTAASGVLVFELSEATGHWKITRIDSK